MSKIVAEPAKADHQQWSASTHETEIPIASVTKRIPLEQGQSHRTRIAAAAKTCLGNPNQLKMEQLACDLALLNLASTANALKIAAF